ncbi:MAG: carboxymuconolactone decarboxylase family protein [Candidatus Omnitrophica bacterium]|nr:carboxymuconolactone decarboxylase family protein [Candidatus Omnitrophota bacterium]
MYAEQIQDKLIDTGSMILKTGHLDIKTKALIGLSTAVTTYCVHCHYQSKSLARRFGATEVEIEEAENIALRMRQKCQMKTQFTEHSERKLPV